MDSKTKAIRPIQEKQVLRTSPDQQTPKHFQAEQELVTGVVPLTPNQHWFFEQNFPDHYFTTGTLFEVSEQLKLDGNVIKKALQHLLVHHDALRARFVQHGAKWTQFIPAPDDNVPFSIMDLSTVPAQEQMSAMKLACKKAESLIDLSADPLLRTILFDLGPDAPHYFFLMIHHLVTDGFSNSIIMQDFITVYQQLSQGKPVQLPQKTTSLKNWSEQLIEYSCSPAIQQELPHWQMQPGESLPGIPITKDPNPVYIIESAYRIAGTLDAESTHILLRNILKKYDMQLIEVMLAAMAEAIGLAKGGDRSLYVDILRHGRDLPLPNVDLSRTVGWTVIHSPLLLRLEDISSFEEALPRVKEQYRRPLDGGAGYDLLRYVNLDDEIRKTLRPRPVVAFSHEAFISGTNTDAPLLIRPVPKVVKDELNPEISWPYFLELRTMVSDNQLHWIWNSGETVYPQSVIEQLSQNFADILKRLTSQEKQMPKDAPTPIQPANSGQVSPQTAAAQLVRNLSPEKQALLAQRLREKQALNHRRKASLFKPRSAGINTFPLSFAQQRLWFLDQLTPGNSAYNMFSAVRLRGALNVTALEYAFNQITQRHESLRTVFQVVNEQPCQVIVPRLQVTIPVIDISSFSGLEQKAEAQRLAQQEAQRPFDLSSGPLVRCTLLRLDENQHILLFAMHHIISDGWSMGVLFREIIFLSQAYSSEGEIHLPALPIQYADFAIWQREWLQGEVLETQLSYWKKQLAAPSILELPTDRLRPLVQSNRGAEHIFTCPPALTQALQTLSRNEGVSLFTTLLTAFQILLSRYSGQTDIIVGSPHANRNRVEVEGLIGYFVNTLVLRADLSGNPAFRKALQQTKLVVSGAHGHQDLPFERLVDELKIERDLSRNPLFQVTFIFQNTPRVAVNNMKGLTLETFERTNENAQFDLTLSIMDTQDGLQGVFTYNVDLFEPETIVRMSKHFQTLLDGIVANPEQPLSDLPMLAEEERQILLQEWNTTRVVYPQGQGIHELVEAQAQRTPEAVAVIFEKQSFTYRELDQRANQLARVLRKQGVGPDTLVAICIERSLEMVVGLLGALKAGGAYVPLDPNYPPERLTYMLEDSGATVLLSQQHLRSLLPQHKTHIICLDQDWEMIARESAAPVNAFVTSDNLAYVIYTSGSTGKPKGTMISHGAIINHMCWMQSTFPFTETDSVLQKTPFSFDASIWEFYAPLLSGARLIMARPTGHQDSAYMCEEIIKHSITTLQLVPSLLRVLLSEPKFKECLSLQRVFCGGEALPADLVENFFACLPAALINLYGPTEATIDATSYACERKSTRRAVPIGRPIANTQTYLLDHNLAPVPTGVAGELYISGAGLARGYLRRPQLTAEKFIPNLFSHEPGAHLYRTGDLARWLPDGNIEYLGRMDQQVKLRGLRIELGEIEAALNQHPSVYDTVVIVREDIPERKQLTAYLVLRQNATVTPNELLDFLRTRLPDYMLPAIFSFLDHMPLTPSSKVDRKALPVPQQMQQGLTREYIAPRTQEELHLAKIWQEILRVEQIGIHDNFFELGGDSLMVMRAIAKSHETGLHFTPQDFFRHQTISTLLDRSSKTWSSASNATSIGAIPIIPTSRIVYADSAPQAFWRILEMLLEVPRILTPAQLEIIVQRLISHHDALRLRLAKENTDYRMFIEAADDRVFQTSDLSDLSDEAQDKFIAAAIDEHWASMNLATGPLVRFVFFALGPKRLPRILVLLHHFAADGYSVQILLEDFQNACTQTLAGETIKFPAKTTSIKEWAERTYAYVKSDAVQGELAYWRSLPWDKLQPPPLDHPEVTMSSYAQELGALSKAETQTLLSWVSASDTDLLDVLLTACFATFSRHIQLQPLSVSVLHQNRNSTFEEIDLSRSVGGIYTSYPFILNSEKDLSSLTMDMLLQLVAEKRALIPNGGSTWHWISYYHNEPILNWRDNLNIAKHVTFNYLGHIKPDIQRQAPIFRQIGTRTEEDASKLYEVANIIPHTCTPSIEEDQLKIRWIYFAGLHEKSTIEKYVQEYLDALRSLISRGSIR